MTKAKKTKKTKNVKKTKKEEVSKIARELWDYDNDLVILTGYDDCILGVVDKIGCDPVVCYDREKILGRLMKDDMTYEEAVEFFDFNIIGAYIGGRTPCFMTKINQLN